ncbi:MAG: HEAT repeat domain-containing protein [Asgard group archaeon]|nr:HEAT repeat domain-containing protein [Asgard group archaeon]
MVVHLGSNKKTIEELIDELEDWGESTREEAAKALGETEDDLAIDPLLKALLHDKSEDVRAASARALCKFDTNKKLAKELGLAMEEEISPIVRIAIANSIGKLENISAAKLMVPILEREESIWVREAIIETFGKMKTQEFSEIIFEHLKEDPSEEVRVQAANALRKRPQEHMLDEILAIFQSETSDEVKSHIVGIIAEIANIKTVEILTDALENEEFKLTQAATAEALHKIASKLGFKDENEMLDSI